MRTDAAQRQRQGTTQMLGKRPAEGSRRNRVMLRHRFGAMRRIALHPLPRLQQDEIIR